MVDGVGGDAKQPEPQGNASVPKSRERPQGGQEDVGHQVLRGMHVADSAIDVTGEGPIVLPVQQREGLPVVFRPFDEVPFMLEGRRGGFAHANLHLCQAHRALQRSHVASNT